MEVEFGRCIMKFGFLFGAGAEVGYGLPSGGKFALDIFRYDTSKSKETFKRMRDEVNTTTRYATQWLPIGFKDKNISSFGKSVFQNIIKDTVEHNRKQIIKRINEFDDIAKSESDRLKKEDGIDINIILEDILQTELDNIHMSQDISFIKEFSDGNRLFDSSYFSALLLVYKNPELFSDTEKLELGKILLSIMQLHIGALSESLTRKINDGVFEKKDDEIDIFDDIGEIIQLNYAASGLSGMEYLLEQRKAETQSDSGKILRFAQNIIESLYAVVLDYKSLIDSNLHYLYSPESDWAKFCKICIFLLNVRNYIEEIAEKASPYTKQGYYHFLKDAIEKNLFDVSAIATTNYNEFIKNILQQKITFLNGSTELWYDPYVNRIGTKDELTNYEKHILVPLMFTQSGTKPMTSIEMSSQYVDTYTEWKRSDAIVIVGFGFGTDDEHINGIIRTLVDIDDKKIIIVALDSPSDDTTLAKEYAHKLKTLKFNNISIIRVDKTGHAVGTDKNWVDFLSNYSNK